MNDFSQDAEFLNVPIFLNEALKIPVVDVRAPAEYARGHIVGASNICLFSNEERAQIGTLYHRKSHQAAYEAGLEMVSPKLNRLVEEARKVAPDGNILLYCLRGGMRSQSLGFLLRTAGFRVRLLQGGYKAFRQYVLNSFVEDLPLLVLGGMTGSGKTATLHRLKNMGQQVIDLEGLANHKGSVFGAIGQQEQPSSEHFENLLFEQWRKVDRSKILWLEDENMDIGQVKLPLAIYRKIRKATMVVIEVPVNIRISRLLEEYSERDELLIQAIRRIERRLGNQGMNNAINAVNEGKLAKAAEILLQYYDESYKAAISKRGTTACLQFPACPATEEEFCLQIIMKAQSLVNSI